MVELFEPDGQKNPTEHGPEHAEDVSPVALPNVPWGQGTAVEFPGQYDPGSHNTHMDPPA